MSLALTFGSVSVAAPGASADDAPPFRNGTANAIAQIARVAPGVGSLSLAMSSGIAVAQTANSLAQAQSKVLDLGLIGTSLTAQQCDGSAGVLRPDQVPQATTVDNRKGDTSAGSDSLAIAGDPLGSGRQTAAATTAPLAHASVTSVASTLGPLLTISGGRSDATARVVDGAAREADATASVDLDIAGVVKLSGAKWQAFHRTGKDATTNGTFLVSDASAGGIPLPVGQLAPLESAINAALATSGVTVTLPQVQHVTEPNDFVRVTPLTITLKDSPAGKTALGPGLNLTRDQRGQLFDAIVGVYCKAAALLLVGDVSLDVASGTGFLTLEIGGAEATTADLVLGDPFGSYTPFGSASTTPTELPSAGAGFAALPRAPGNPVGPTAPRTVAAIGPLEHLCESLSPSKSRGCSSGRGWPVGIAGLGLTVGVGYLDWRKHRAHLAKAAGATP